jgi:hypothetical protein
MGRCIGLRPNSIFNGDHPAVAGSLHGDGEQLLFAGVELDFGLLLDWRLVAAVGMGSR